MLFRSQERAEREYQRLGKKQQDFQQLQQKLSGELMEEQAKTMMALSDTIWSQIRTYNELHGHYQVILSNQGGSIIYSVPMYDITEEVVKYLNDQYDPSKSNPEKKEETKK